MQYKQKIQTYYSTSSIVTTQMNRGVVAIELVVGLQIYLFASTPRGDSAGFDVDWKVVINTLVPIKCIIYADLLI